MMVLSDILIAKIREAHPRIHVEYYVSNNGNGMGDMEVYRIWENGESSVKSDVICDKDGVCVCNRKTAHNSFIYWSDPECIDKVSLAL